MTQEFERIEGSVPKQTKSWFKRHAYEIKSDLKEVVGIACSLYKAQYDNSTLGKDVTNLYLASDLMEKCVANLHEIDNISSKSYAFLRENVEFCAFKITLSHKKRQKNTLSSEKDKRSKVIKDVMASLLYIKDSNEQGYKECCDILLKSTKGEDTTLVIKLMEHNRGIEQTRIYNYIGNTLDDNSDLTQIKEMAHNCMTVPMKHRDEKIQNTMKIISDTFDEANISEYISIFQNELKQLEAKK